MGEPSSVVEPVAFTPREVQLEPLSYETYQRLSSPIFRRGVTPSLPVAPVSPWAPFVTVNVVLVPLERVMV